MIPNHIDQIFDEYQSNPQNPKDPVIMAATMSVAMTLRVLEDYHAWVQSKTDE